MILGKYQVPMLQMVSLPNFSSLAGLEVAWLIRSSLLGKAY